MKHLKLLLLGAVSALLMLFVVFVPMRANAATIENGVPNALKREGKAFYKITLEDDSLVTITWVKNTRDLAKFAFYEDKNKNNCLTYVNVSFGPVSGKIVVPMKRGTYYVDMYDGDANHAPTTKVKFTWRSAAQYAGDNYSLATAQTLKANTLVQAVQIRKYNYTRWYKINLTKEQRIIVEGYNGEYLPPFKILTSKLEELNLKTAYGDFATTKKLPKGTYYIVIPENTASYDYVFGYYYAFKWR